MYRLETSYWWYTGLHELVHRELSRRNRSGMILDAGCGTGAMLRRLQAFGQAHGVDESMLALRYCKKRNLSCIARGTVESLPFNDSIFDFVVSMDVLYHSMVKDDRKALDELRRVLKHGGLLILNLPAFEFLRGSHDVAVHTKRRYTRRDLREKLTSAGFEIEKITYRNSILFPAIFLRRVLTRRNSDSDLQQMSNTLNSILTGILSFENRILSRMSIAFGSSLFCIAKKR